MIAFKNVVLIPGASIKEMYTINPFTTKVKRPRLSKMAGSDKMITIGRSMVLTSEKINPAKRKPKRPAVNKSLS